MIASSSKQSIVLKVGEGRGFVVAPKWSLSREQYVITAAHCLPSFPPRISFSYPWERIYRKLLSPIGRRRSVSAECVFVDPVADIAVLGSPDNQQFDEEANAYEQLLETMKPLAVSDIKGETAPAELVSLEQRKFRCVVTVVRRGPFRTTKATQEVSHLPGWLLAELGVRLSRGCNSPQKINK